MCDSCTLLHDPSKNGAAKSQIPMRGPIETVKNSNEHCWRALGSIFDDSYTLLGGAR